MIKFSSKKYLIFYANEKNQGHDKRPLVLKRAAKPTVAGLVDASLLNLPKSVPPRSICPVWPICRMFCVVTEYSSPEPGVMGWHIRS